MKNNQKKMNRVLSQNKGWLPDKPYKKSYQKRVEFIGNNKYVIINKKQENFKPF